jgi:hypothetical protein
MAHVQLFEVKFLLEPVSVFEAEASIDDLRLRAGAPFDETPKERRMTVSFVDGVTEALRERRWSVRVRRDLKAGGKEKASYKRRFAVEGGDDAALADAVRRASLEFPDLGTGALELDWGRLRRTLSVGFPGYEGVPIGVRAAAVQALPPVLEDDRDLLGGGREFGPVPAKRWTAKSDAVGEKLELELWRLPSGSGGHQDVLEVSFEQRDGARAAEGRERLLETIAGSAWRLAAGDGLKTERLFAAFRPLAPQPSVAAGASA